MKGGKRKRQGLEQREFGDILEWVLVCKCECQRNKSKRKRITNRLESKLIETQEEVDDEIGPKKESNGKKRKK